MPIWPGMPTMRGIIDEGKENGILDASVTADGVRSYIREVIKKTTRAHYLRIPMHTLPVCCAAKI